MIHRTVRGVFQGFGALALLALVAVPLFVWRLSEGPVSVAFLTPYVEEALSSPDKAYSVQLDDTVLTLDDNRYLDIRAKGVRLIGSTGQMLASIPEIGITLSPKSLARGVLGLRRIAIVHPVLRLTRGGDGKLDLDFAGVADGQSLPTEVVTQNTQKNLIDTLLEELVAPLDPNRTFGVLSSLRIQQADLTLVDKLNDTVWHAPSVDLQIARGGEGISGSGTAELTFENGAARIDLGLNFEPTSRLLSIGFGFDKLAPAHLARLMPELSPLTAIDLPLAGSVKTEIDISTGLVGRIDFDMAGGAGRLVLPEPVSEEVPVSSLKLKGAITDGGNRTVLEEFSANLDGPLLTLGGIVDRKDGETFVQGEANAKDVPMERLKHLWPESLAVDARTWIMANLSLGKAKDVTARFAFKMDKDGAVALTALSGGGDVEGMRVNYLAPMPQAENVSAYMSFTPNSYHLDIKDGSVFGLKTKGGRLNFTGLDQPDQFLEVNLDIEGPLEDALKLIDSKPLGYAQALGIDPERVKGQVSGHFFTSFPLLKALTFDMLALETKARLENLEMPKMLMGLDITGGSGDLRVDPKGLDLVGKVHLANMAADLEWRENFTKSAAFRSRYRIKGLLDDAGRAAMGLDMPPFTPSWLEGPVGIDALATLQTGGKGEALLKLDLTPARLSLQPVNYRKAPGARGNGEVQLTFSRKGLAAVPRIQVMAEGLNLTGGVQFAGEGGPLKRVDITRLHADRSEAFGSLAVEPSGRITVDVKGDALDASALLKDDGAPADRKAPPMAVQASLKRLWINEKGSLETAQASLSRSEGLWRNVTAEGLAGGKPFRLSILPDGRERRRLIVVSPDAGATISGLGILDNVTGGKLEVGGTYDDSKPESPLEGTARMSDFNVVRAPVLARILTVAGITGIVDALKGEGISFSRLEAPFILSRGKLYLSEARASGAALGVTAKGNVDMTNDVFDLEGTLVPAYAVNSLLGNIPLVGGIFSGGDKGGGVFAFTYSLKGHADDPSVSVNPLAALAPGFLRNLFGIFDKGPTQAPPEAKKP
ncbi:MAG: AsmA-like C-terminal domain-containing protein [Alphaproteobacteria bacterium]|nr:AsmA-like C-terminal domain-containing protein [Alphaproteobacteria bacterium]